MTFETKSATAVLKSNLIRSIEFVMAVAWCLKRASLGTNVNTPFYQVLTLEFRNGAGAETLYSAQKWAPGPCVHNVFVISGGFHLFVPAATRWPLIRCYLREIWPDSKRNLALVVREMKGRRGQHLIKHFWLGQKHQLLCVFVFISLVWNSLQMLMRIQDFKFEAKHFIQE